MSCSISHVMDFYVPNTLSSNFLCFSFPLFYYYTLSLFLYFFLFLLFCIPLFQTGPTWSTQTLFSIAGRATAPFLLLIFLPP